MQSAASNAGGYDVSAQLEVVQVGMHREQGGYTLTTLNLLEIFIRVIFLFYFPKKDF